MMEFSPIHSTEAMRNRLGWIKTGVTAWLEKNMRVSCTFSEAGTSSDSENIDILNCYSSTTVEPMTSGGGGEHANPGGLHETTRKPPVRSALIWIPVLSRGLD